MNEKHQATRDEASPQSSAPLPTTEAEGIAALKDRVVLLEGALREIFEAHSWAVPHGHNEMYNSHIVSKAIYEASKKVGRL